MDVLVVGGGFTGLSTALHLAERHPHLRIAVLEARRVGSGASGRCGGMALHWFHSPHDGDDESLVEEWRLTDEVIASMDGLSARYAFPLRIRRGGALDVHAPGRDAEQAHKLTERLSGLGLPVSWLSGRALTARLDLRDAYGAMYDPDAMVIHPMDWLIGLREALLGLGVAVYERSPVTHLSLGAEIEATTESGQIRANAVVLGTGAWTSSLGLFPHAVLPLHAHVVATKSFSDSWWTLNGFAGIAGMSDDAPRLGWSALSPMGHLLLGGGSNDGYAYRACGRRTWPYPRTVAQTEIHSHFTGWMPFLAGAPIERSWTGVVDLSLDRMPRMGVTGPYNNVYYALGFSGHGVVMANLAGRVLADTYDGDTQRWQNTPFFQQPFRPWPPEPFRWVGYQLATRWTGRSPRARS